MKKTLTLISISIALLACSTQPTEQLTILSYNVRNGVGMDNVQNYDRTANVIAQCTPDVAALQEIDSMTARSNQTEILSVMAAKNSLNPTFAKAINYDGGAYGVGLLSKLKPLKTGRIPLPGKEEKRVLLVAEFDKYVFCITHFSLTASDQITSLQILDSVTRSYKKPVFVAGDMNFLPSDEQFQLLKEKYIILSPIECGTYPADNPTQCIDYILMRKADRNYVSVVSSEVVDAAMESDHRPIKVVVNLH